MVDKDLNEISRLREAYPDVSVLLCRFHVLKAFKSGISAHASTDNRDSIADIKEEMVYSRDEEVCEKCKEKLQDLDGDFFTYFCSSWDPMKTSWAGCFTLYRTHDGHFTNNMVESHNQKIKKAVKRFSSVPSLVTELIKIAASKKFANQQKSVQCC